MSYGPTEIHGYSYKLVFGSPVNSNVAIPLTIDPGNYGLPEAVTDAMVQEIVDLVSKSQNFVILSSLKVVNTEQQITPNAVPEVLDPGALEPTVTTE